MATRGAKERGLVRLIGVPKWDEQDDKETDEAGGNAAVVAAGSESTLHKGSSRK